MTALDRRMTNPTGYRKRRFRRSAPPTRLLIVPFMPIGARMSATLMRLRTAKSAEQAWILEVRRGARGWKLIAVPLAIAVVVGDPVDNRLARLTVTMVWPTVPLVDRSAEAVTGVPVPWKLCAAAGDGPAANPMASARLETRAVRRQLATRHHDLQGNRIAAGQRDQEAAISLAIVESGLFERHGDRGVEAKRSSSSARSPPPADVRCSAPPPSFLFHTQAASPNR